jgi:hypothetical protein
MSNSCVKSYPTNGSLGQGEQFAEMTKTFHGGSRKNMRKNKKMLSRKNRRNMKGGSFFTPYADYQTEFDQMLPSDLRTLSGVASLDKAFTELPAIERAAGVMSGGSRRKNRNKRNNRSKRMRGGSAPIDEPSMLIRTPADEMAARLNPQWYTENTVIPNFRGPIPIPGGTVPAPLAPSPPVPKVGGRRRNLRKSRKFCRR